MRYHGNKSRKNSQNVLYCWQRSRIERNQCSITARRNVSQFQEEREMKQLLRGQRCLSRKYENLKKGESTQRTNIQKQKQKVQKLHHKADNIRTDSINKTIAETVKTKPSYIAMEESLLWMYFVGRYRWLSRELTTVECTKNL